MKINKYRVFKIEILVLLVYMAISSNVYASTKICYRGLSSGKALIDIDEFTVELTPGDSFRNYVKLLSANEEVIVLEVSGKRYLYKKNSSRGTILAEEVILTCGPGGSYWAKGKVNGNDVTFIVDTGASQVVLNKEQAMALEVELGNKEVQMGTASKIETVYQVLLDTVSVGHIKMHNIPALITKHTYPQKPLLGMSFLQHFDISQKNGRMILKCSD